MLTNSKLRLTLGAFVLMYAAHPLWVHAEENRALRVSAVRYDSKGVKLAVGKENGSITVYDTASKQTLWSTTPTKVKIHALYFRESDTQLVAIEFRGNIKVYAATSGRLLRDFKPNLLRAYGDRDEKIKAAEIDPSGSVLAIAGDLFNVITFVNLDVAINQVKESELRLSDYVHVVTGFENIAVATIPKEKPSMAYMGSIDFLAEHHDTITDLRFNANSAYLAATTEKGYLIVWKFMPEDFANGRLMRVSEVEPYIRKVGSSQSEYRALSGLAISEKRVLTIGDPSKYGAMQLWDIEKGEMIQYEKDVDPSVPTRIAFNRNGQMAVSTSDMMYRLWAVNDNELKRLCSLYFEDDAYGDAYHNAVDFSPTQNVVAMGYLSNVYLLDISSLKVVQKFGASVGKLNIIPAEKPGR